MCSTRVRFIVVFGFALGAKIVFQGNKVQLYSLVTQILNGSIIINEDKHKMKVFII